jgi:hypothetical protein
MNSFGIHYDGEMPHLSDVDKRVIENIRTSVDDDEKMPTAFWPHISDTPVSEYDAGVKLFACAFPWLFPGGIGDYNVERRSKNYTVGHWAESLLYYEDGRFATDRMWCFFVLNYVTRRRNQDAGSFFVDGFYKDVPMSISELQAELRKGNTKYLDKISYYSQKVRGSPGFWRTKRAELLSWINYHAERGHGLPTFFITLSCAEYYWPDIIRLLNERLAMAGHPDAV